MGLRQIYWSSPVAPRSAISTSFGRRWKGWAYGWRFAAFTCGPGKATMFGTMNGMPVLSLPGNAVAALVSALVFLKPILSALEGAGYEALACEPAILAHPMTGGGPRNTFLRGRLDRRSDGSQAFAAQPIQDNAMISGLAEANALVLRPAGAPALEAGAPIEAIRFDLIAGF